MKEIYDTEAMDSKQYSLLKILMLWFLVTLPMGISRYLLYPWLKGFDILNPSILYWLLMIVGMVWQFVLSLLVLKRELGKLTWLKLKQRLWLNPPISPKTGRTNHWLYLSIIPVMLYALFIGSPIFYGITDGFLALFPGLQPPPEILLESLAASEFTGALYLIPIALVSSLFNYILGEELFFRGILLPKMRGAFRKYDWLANGILFSLYHVHKLHDLPIMLISSLFYAYPNSRYRSIFPTLILHGLEFIPVMVVIVMIVFR